MRVGLLVSLFSMALILAAPVQAGTYVDMPGLTVDTSAGGTSVTMPGLTVDTGAGGAAVATSGAPALVAAGGGKSYVNATLTGMDFRGQNLAGANFTNATLTGTDFSGANLSGALFTNADLTDTRFVGAILAGADMSNTTLVRTDLTNANLSQVNLTNATIEGALTNGARFDGATLTNVDMSMLVRTGPAMVAIAAPPPAPRPVFVDAQAISQALTVDPANPTVPRSIDLTVNFDFNSDKLTADGVKQVQEIATALTASSLKGARIMVEGHTDNVGTDKYNQGLSHRRAMRVLNTLRDEYSISSVDLMAKGYGESKPIASNETDLGRAQNRRVTLVNMGK